MTNYQQKLHQLDGRQQELVRDNHELKDLCLYLDEERNCIDLSCPHCGEKTLSRPNSVVPEDDDPVTSRKFLNHKSKDDIAFKTQLKQHLHGLRIRVTFLCSNLSGSKTIKIK